MQKIIKNWYYNQSDVSIQDVADSLNVSVSRAYHIVSGNFARLDPAQVNALCRLVGITPNELFDFSPSYQSSEAAHPP
jgi:hypothetical protein